MTRSEMGSAIAHVRDLRERHRRMRAVLERCAEPRELAEIGDEEMAAALWDAGFLEITPGAKLAVRGFATGDRLGDNALSEKR
jgi:hypothetical protein